MTQEQVLTLYEQQKSRHLGYSILLDALGMFTYAIPLLGELGDIIYAPIYGIAIFAMYRIRVASAAVGGVVGFTEELLPGTDFIPSASVMWLYHYHLRRQSTMKKFIKRKMKDEYMVENLLAQDYSPRPNVFKRVGNSVLSLFSERPSKQRRGKDRPSGDISDAEIID